MTKQPSFRPSSSERWVPCPGSWGLEKDLPRSESPQMLQGTGAHAVSDWVFENRTYLTNSMDGRSIGTMLKKPKLKMVYIDREMIRCINAYCSFVWKLAQDYGMMIYPEQKVYLKNAPVRYGGTVDRLFISQRQDRLMVLDLKYGLKHVSAVENPQLVSYALGALDYYVPCEKDIPVHIIIYQPRSGKEPEEVWETTSDYLQTHWESKITLAMEVAMSSNPGYSEGDHCVWCLARKHGTCPLKAKKIAGLATVHAPTLMHNVDQIQPQDPQMVAQLLDRVKPIKEAIKLLEDKAQTMAEDGVNIPGYRLIDRLGHTKWKHPEIAKSHLRDAGFHSDDFMTPREFRSPAQIKKLAGKVSWIKANTERPVSGQKLVTEKANPDEDFEVIE